MFTPKSRLTSESASQIQGSPRRETRPSSLATACGISCTTPSRQAAASSRHTPAHASAPANASSWVRQHTPQRRRQLGGERTADPRPAAADRISCPRERHWQGKQPQRAQQRRPHAQAWASGIQRHAANRLAAQARASGYRRRCARRAAAQSGHPTEGGTATCQGRARQPRRLRQATATRRRPSCYRTKDASKRVAAYCGPSLRELWKHRAQPRGPLVSPNGFGRVSHRSRRQATRCNQAEVPLGDARVR